MGDTDIMREEGRMTMLYDNMTLSRHIFTPKFLNLNTTGVANLSEVTEKPLLRFHHIHIVKFAGHLRTFKT